MLIRQDAFLQSSSGEQSDLIRSLFALSYLTKDDFYTDNFARLSRAGALQGSKSVASSGAPHIKEDKTKMKGSIAKVASTSQTNTATAVKQQGRFLKIAKKVWSSDTTVMNLNIVYLEAFIDSKFGKP